MSAFEIKDLVLSVGQQHELDSLSPVGFMCQCGYEVDDIEEMEQEFDNAFQAWLDHFGEILQGAQNKEMSSMLQDLVPALLGVALPGSEDDE